MGPTETVSALGGLPEGRFSGAAEFSALVRTALVQAAEEGWAEMVWSGITATEPILMATMGEGGRRFLELTDIGLEPASAESIVAMFQSRYRVARAWREFLTTYPLIVGPTWTQFACLTIRG